MVGVDPDQLEPAGDRVLLAVASWDAVQNGNAPGLTGKALLALQGPGLGAGPAPLVDFGGSVPLAVDQGVADRVGLPGLVL